MQLRILKWIHRVFYRIHQKSQSVALRLQRDIYFYQLEERESDVYIVTFPKSGTTWMQVIVYNLLTDGKMDFEHIYDVSPWLSNQAHLGEDPQKVNELPSQRYFKSHDKYEQFNPGFKNKIIYVYRDGQDVANSYFHHNKNYLNPDLTFDKNFENHFTDPDKPLNWFKYNKEWMENKHRFNILYISYEDLKNDFVPTLHEIAFFLGVKLNPEIIDRTIFHASFSYMKEHEVKFGEVAPQRKSLVFDQFIRNGESGAGKNVFSEEQSKLYQENYDKFLKDFWPKKKKKLFIKNEDITSQ